MNSNRGSTHGWTMSKVAVVGIALILASCLSGRAQLLRSPGDQVDMVFKDFDNPHSPGCAVAVMDHGSIIFSKGYGRADLGRAIDIKPTTVFHAASLTKQFTAMAIMLLVNAGDLSLDDRVDKFITVPIATRHNMKIRELLSHLSGIRDHWVLVALAGKHLYDEVVTQADVLNLISRMETVDFEPGEGILYSNTGFTLAAMIVKKITGHSLSEFADKKIFEPLGMRNTHIIEKHDQMPRGSAQGYTGDRPFTLFMPNLDVTGPTNLITTVEDLALWDNNFALKAVGGDAALVPMQTPAILTKGPHAGDPAQFKRDDEGNPINYGLGLILTAHRGHNVVEHDGRDAGYRSHLIRFPNEQISVALLCNLALPEEIMTRILVRKVADIFLHDRPGLASHHLPPGGHPTGHPSVPAAELTKFVGKYHSNEIDSTYQVILQPGGQLVIRRDKYQDTPLIPASPSAGVFNIKEFGRPITDGIVRFVPSGGTVTGFDLTGERYGLPRIHEFPFKKLP